MMRENVKLAYLTTFKIGGEARYFYEVKDISELKEAVSFAKGNGWPVFVLGGGANVLISDEGFKGVVIKIGFQGVSFLEQKDHFEIEGGAGENWDNLVSLTVAKKITGLENLSNIPGSIGGAIVQNIGAYGKEIASYVFGVEVYDKVEEKIKILNGTDCQFGYRESIFKKDYGKNFIITKVILRLPKSEELNFSYKDLAEFFKGTTLPNLNEVREAVIKIRQAKLPDPKKFGTAGSYFKNPIIEKVKAAALKKHFPEMPVWEIGKDLSRVGAAYLVDKVANLKGFSVGGAQVFEKQALVLVNTQNATANDILKLAEKIKKAVEEKTGITLEEEVEFIS